MRQQLKRIEATLDQLSTQEASSRHSSRPFPRTRASSRNASLASLISPTISYSLDAATPAPEAVTVSTQVAPEATPRFKETPSFNLTTESLGEFVPPFSVDQTPTRLPSLPKFKSAHFTSHRNGANPALAMNLLRELETIVAAWQAELHDVLRQIQDLYLEGPIVDGWLESQPQDGDTSVPPLRHAEVNHLLHYVDEMLSPQAASSSPSARTGYRLCGLNPDGQLWCRPCPPDQVPSVSLAIARYHKLRQLLTRKQQLETRLTQLAETLIVVHGHLK